MVGIVEAQKLFAMAADVGELERKGIAESVLDAQIPSGRVGPAQIRIHGQDGAGIVAQAPRLSANCIESESGATEGRSGARRSR